MRSESKMLYDKLKRQIMSAIPTIEQSLKNLGDSQIVQISNTTISKDEAQRLYDEMKRILETPQCNNFDRKAIPMKLVVGDYLWTQIQATMNEIVELNLR